MEKYTLRRKVAGVVLVALGGLTVAGCSEPTPNYEGRGNDYEVTGIVSGVEGDDTIHINENDLTIVSEHGRAATWFKNHDGQDMFSDEFNFEPRYRKREEGWFGKCEHDVYIGKVLSPNGEQIKPTDLQAGDIVDIQGEIRDSNVWRSTGKSGYCGTEEYPVFDTVRVVQYRPN